MFLKTKLQAKEGKWIRVYFPDSSYMTGCLNHVGDDFIQLECYGRDDARSNEHCAYTQHLIPLNFIKFFTIEATSFIEAEKRRLEYIVKNGNVVEEELSNRFSEQER